MALAAAHFETGGGPEEYAALRQLSALPCPALSVAPGHDRETVTTFVPVNDDSSPLSKKGKPIMPSGSMAVGRDRQPRSFPVAVPERESVFLIWEHAVLPDLQRRALEELCRKVAAVGHSASLVQMWVESDPPEPDVVPSEGAGAPLRLRVPWRERLGELEGSHEAGLRPNVAGWHGYAPPETVPAPTAPPASAFASDLVVLRRVEGRSLGLESTLILTEALRGAVMKTCPDPPPEWISGHKGAVPDGPPSDRLHLAFLPLANVGHQHADGRLLGVALAIPREIAGAEQRRCLSPLLFNPQGYLAPLHLAFGRLGDWEVILDDREDRPQALRPETWTSSSPARPSARFASVTPVVLDRYPKAGGDAESTIVQACKRIGLPKPVEVIVSRAPLFAGVPHAAAFPPLLSGPNGTKRYHTHAVIRFAEPVCGPVLIGAGRYRGYGFCRPLPKEAS
jgi:CRISPR-associated protein Csb2